MVELVDLNNSESISNISQFYNNLSTTDVTIQIQNEDNTMTSFPTHKLFLAQESEYFYDLFYGVKQENGVQICEVFLKDISADAFRLTLDYIYKGAAAKCTVNQLLQIWHISHVCKFGNLFNDCGKVLSKMIDLTTVGPIFNHAAMFGFNYVKIACMDFLNNVKFFTLSDDGFFGTINADILRQLLNSDRLQAPENELFCGVEVWAKAECKRRGLEETDENLREVGLPAVKQIRFLNIPYDEFKHTKSRILTEYEKSAILENLRNTQKIGSVTPWPAGFSLILHNRNAPSNLAVKSRKKNKSIFVVPSRDRALKIILITPGDKFRFQIDVKFGMTINRIILKEKLDMPFRVCFDGNSKVANFSHSGNVNVYLEPGKIHRGSIELAIKKPLPVKQFIPSKKTFTLLHCPHGETSLQRGAFLTFENMEYSPINCLIYRFWP